jgi:hypothetical protein
MGEEQYINIHDLVKDFARLIDIQKKEIIDLQAELQEYRSIAENMGAAKAVSKKEAWEKIADHFYPYVQAYVNTAKNAQSHQEANQLIAEYKTLKNE